MQLSDEMVERAVAAAERGWGDGLAFASCVREGLRAAVDSIPDPTSVSVPQGDGIRKEEWQWHKELDFCHLRSGELRAELEKTRAQLDEYLCAEREMGIAADQTGEHLPLVMVARRLSTELEMRTREIEKTRAELEACKRDLCERAGELGRAHGELETKREDAEALRAALVECVWAMETWGSWEDGVPLPDEGGDHGRVGKAYDTARMLLGYADDGKRIGALLKPAPAEAEPVIVRFRADPPLMEPVQHPPPESAMVPASLQPLTARVERLERALRILSRATQRNGEPLDYDRKAFALALDARKGAGHD